MCKSEIFFPSNLDFDLVMRRRDSAGNRSMLYQLFGRCLFLFFPIFGQWKSFFFSHAREIQTIRGKKETEKMNWCGFEIWIPEQQFETSPSERLLAPLFRIYQPHFFKISHSHFLHPWEKHTCRGDSTLFARAVILKVLNFFMSHSPLLSLVPTRVNASTGSDIIGTLENHPKSILYIWEFR